MFCLKVNQWWLGRTVVLLWIEGWLLSMEINWSFFKFLICHRVLISLSYVVRTWQHWNGYDTWTHDKFFKVHATRVSDTFRTGHDFIWNYYSYIEILAVVSFFSCSWSLGNTSCEILASNYDEEGYFSALVLIKDYPFVRILFV